MRLFYSIWFIVELGIEFQVEVNFSISILRAFLIVFLFHISLRRNLKLFWFQILVLNMYTHALLVACSFFFFCLHWSEISQWCMCLVSFFLSFIKLGTWWVFLMCSGKFLALFLIIAYSSPFSLLSFYNCHYSNVGHLWWSFLLFILFSPVFLLCIFSLLWWRVGNVGVRENSLDIIFLPS